MIAIADYGMGNLGSIRNMFRKVGVPAVITSDPVVLADAERVVLPGVGAFDHGMRSLEERGLLEVLHRKAREERVPVLGVCLGMQLMTGRSEEGVLPGLGWIEGETVAFDRAGRPELSRLHMGWNTLDSFRPHPLLAELDGDARFYFVHAYHVVCRNERDVLSTSTYAYPFASGVADGNVVGLQFHPEKSHRFGMAVFRAFASWTPSGARAADAGAQPGRAA